jgi:hypothetical protein
MSYIMIWKNPGHLVSRDEFCKTLGQISLKHINRDCRVKTGGMGPYVNVNTVNYF